MLYDILKINDYSNTLNIIFSVLLQNKADPTIKNTEGNTALDLGEPICKSVLRGDVITITRKIILEYFILKVHSSMCR